MAVVLLRESRQGARESSNAGTVRPVDLTIAARDTDEYNLCLCARVDVIERHMYGFRDSTFVRAGRSTPKCDLAVSTPRHQLQVQF